MAGSGATAISFGLARPRVETKRACRRALIYTGCFVTFGTHFGSWFVRLKIMEKSHMNIDVLSVFVYEIQWIFCFNHFYKRCSVWSPCIWRQASCHSSGYSLSVIPGVSRICRKRCCILTRSISACSIDVACTIDFLLCDYLKVQQISQYSLNQFSFC